MLLREILRLCFGKSLRRLFRFSSEPTQSIRRPSKQPTGKVGRYKPLFETLEDRLAPAVITYTLGTKLLDFTSDPGQADNIAIMSPVADRVQIDVVGDTITFPGATPAGFTLSLGDTRVVIDTTVAAITDFNINLGDMGDLLAFGLANPVDVTNVNIQGQAGTDAVTLNALTIMGNLTVDSETINLGGTVTATGNVTLTAVNSLTDGADDDGADIAGAVVTLNVTGAGNTIGVGPTNFLEIDAATRLDATTNNGLMVLKNVAGNLPLGTLNAGNTFIFLTARNGAIIDANGAAVNLTAANGVSLTTTGPSSAIGTAVDAIETAIGALTATTNDGGIYVSDSNGPGFIINTVLAKQGGFTPQIGANDLIILDDADGPGPTPPVVGTFDVSIVALNTILLNSLTAPDKATIKSINGDILDANAGSSNVLARSVVFEADGTIGQLVDPIVSSDPLEITVENFSASANNGDVALAQGIAGTAFSVVAGGDVLVTSTGSTLRVKEIIAQGNATVKNDFGSLVEDNAAIVSVVGQLVNLTGKTGLGTLADPFKTTATDLFATVIDPGAPIYIAETDGLNSVGAKTNAGDVGITFTGGSLVFTASTTVLSASGAAVSFETTAGDVQLGLVDAGIAAVNITAFGAILDNVNDAVLDLRGGMVTLKASTGIGASGNEIDTEVGTLNATTNGGGVFIREANALTLNASTTVGDINVRNATGAMTVGFVSASGLVTLQAAAGAILDGNGVNNNVVATTLNLSATGGIGAVGDGLETSVDFLSAAGGAGGLLIANNKSLTLNSATATGGNVSISATGNMTLAGAVIAIGQNVTLNAAGALIDVNGGNDITAAMIMLNAAKIGDSGDKIDTTAAAITAATTTGGIFLSNTAATLALDATAVGAAADIDIDTTGDIVLGAVTAQGDTVKLLAGGAITDGNDPPITVNVTAKKVDVAAPGGIGTAAAPVEMDVDVVLNANGGAAGAFITFTGPLLLTEAALEAAGSGTLTFDAQSITIENIADNTATIAPGRSLVLRTPAGAIVFLDTSDTIETAGLGTITVQAGTALGIGEIAVAVLGNLKTAGGDILVEADRTITIGRLDAGTGDVTVRSLTGIIIDGNGPALNVIAGTTTLSGAGPTDRAAELDETFRIAEAAAAAAEAAAKQTAAEALGTGQAILDAEVALETAAVATAAADAVVKTAAYNAKQKLVNDLAIAATAADVASLVATTAATAALIIAGPAQAIPLIGDAGTFAVQATLQVIANVLEGVSAGLAIGLTVESIALIDIGYAATVADFTENSARTTLALAIAVQQAFAESGSITLAAAEKAAIVRDAAAGIRDQAILARDQANVIGTFATPLGIQVTGVINVAAGPTDSYLQVVGPTALDLIQTTGSVTLISTGAITDADAGAGADILATGLRIVAVGGIGSAADPLETRVATLNASNTGGGDIAISNTVGTPGPLDITGISNQGGGDVFISNKGNTAAGQGITISGPITVTGGTAGVTILSGSPQVISADITAPGAILEAAGETAGPGDDLTVESGVTIHSTGSNVTLRAGDNILISAGSTIQAATTINITANFNDDAADTTGAIVVVAGTLIAPIALIGVDPAADDNDTFTITPSVLTPITVDAEDGTDTLNILADGLPVTIVGNQITVAGRQPVTFLNFEFVNILNAGGGGSITLLAEPGDADVLVLTGTGQGAGTFTLNGVIPISFSGVDSFFFNAGDMDDAVTVTPFATALVKWDVAVTIDGGTGTDRITYNNMAGLDDNTSVTAIGPQAGRINATGVTSALNGQVVSFTNVEDITANANAGENEKLTVNLRDTSAADTANLLFDPDAGDDDIQLVGLFDLVIDTDNYVHLTLDGNAGDDTFILNLVGAGGAAAGTLPIPVTLNGGPPLGNDTVTIIGNANAGDIFTITPGADSQSGLAAISGTDTGTVVFGGIEAITLDGGGGTGTDVMTLQGTPVANIFTLNGTGNLAGTARVDAGPLVTFSAFGTTSSAINLNGLEGDDTFNLTLGANFGFGAVNVTGGDPTASDTAIINGTAGLDAVNFAPTASDAMTITGLGPVISMTTTEHVIYNGQGGQDDITVTTPAGLQRVQLFPGILPDSGTVAINDPSGSSFLGLSFQNLGIGNSSLTIANTGGGRVDDLIYNGRDLANGSEVFTVLAAGEIRLTEPAAVGSAFLFPEVFTPGIRNLTLNGLAGDDVFNIPGGHPFSNILVDGGNPSASDVLNFTGSATVANLISANYGAATVQEATFGAVHYTGIEILNIDANNHDLTIQGTAGNDAMTVVPTGANTVTAALTSTAPNIGGTPVLNGANIATLNVDLLAGSDKLRVNGTEVADTIAVNGTSVAVTGLETVNYANVQNLEVFGLAGNDNITVTPAANTTIFVDGGDPIGSTAGDRIILNPPGVFIIETGPERDEGGLNAAGTQRVSWDHIEAVTVNGGGPAIILGTNGDDDITIIARDASYDAGADGVRDFTVSVNNGPEILFLNQIAVLVDARAGDDDIVVREPAPNSALWDVQVFIAGGTPAAATGDQGDVLAVETPGTQTVIFTPNPAAIAAFVSGIVTVTPTPGINTAILNDTTNTSRIVTATFQVTVTGLGTFFTSSPGGVEQIVYTGLGGGDNLTLNGTAQNDTFVIDVNNGGSGSFRSNLAPSFDFSGAIVSSVNGGGAAGSDFDSIRLLGTPAADVVDLFQAAPGVAANSNYLLNYTINGVVRHITIVQDAAGVPGTVGIRPTIEEVVFVAGSGNDTIRVGHADAYGDANPANGVPNQTWRWHISGDSPNASDRLIIRDDGLGDLIVHYRAPDSRSGRVSVAPGATILNGGVGLADIVYDGIERVDITPLNNVTGGTGTDGAGRVMVFQDDPFESNESRQFAGEIARVGQSATSPVINPGADPFFNAGADEDWFEFRPQFTSTYQVRILFERVGALANGRAGLPGTGDLDLQIYDANGNLIVAGVADADGNNRAAIFGATPDVAQFARIFVRVRGASSASINVYDFENLAGVGSNVPGVSNVDIFGPQVTRVAIPDDPATAANESQYNLFVPKPTTGPTPLITSLDIFLRDQPSRAPGFLYNALANLFNNNADTSANPEAARGLFKVIGDQFGNAPIADVDVFFDAVVVGQPATARVHIIFDVTGAGAFRGGLPDDRWTLTILDGLTDPAGNKLDGESNAAQPLGAPSFPSGDGTAGGNFLARFTVDTRPEIGTYGNALAFLDINGNGVFDPEGVAGDQTNRDLNHNFGLLTDRLFAGNFAPAGVAPASGFDKLGAYGYTNGVFRWLLDFNHDGVPDYGVVSGLQINGLPVAGNFSAAHPGDEIGLFDGTRWYLDTNGNNNIDAGDAVIFNGLVGLPIVGDFDGDGIYDLATYRADNDTFYFDLAFNGFGGADTSLSLAQPGFTSGVTEQPVVADMNGDGIDDLGLFLPGSVTQNQYSDAVDWLFLVSTSGAPTPGAITALNHAFSPNPLGNDLAYSFGDQSQLPLVGNFDPPVAAATVNRAPVLGPVPNHALPFQQDLTSTYIGAVDPDGDLVALSAIARSLPGAAYLIDQQLGLTSSGNYSTNAHSLNEKWMYDASGNPFALLPNGELRQWTGTVAALLSPEALYATFDETFYANPSKLWNAGSVSGIVPVSLSLDGSLLTINPAAGFLDDFLVQLTASDGSAAARRWFKVDILAPSLDPLADHNIGHRAVDQIELADYLHYGTSNPTFGAQIGQYTYLRDLDQLLGFIQRTDHPTDAGQPAAHWLFSTVQQAFYQILPSGELRYWHAATSTPYTTNVYLPTFVYDDTTLLSDPMAPPSASLLSAAVNGSILTLDPADNALGIFTVTVTVNVDGINVTRSFFVNVTNNRPTMSAIADRSMSASLPLSFALDASDPDGPADVLSFSTSVAQYTYLNDLDLALGFVQPTVHPTDPSQPSAHWLYSNNQSAFYQILPTGELRYWYAVTNTPYTTNVFLPTFVYDDTTLLSDPTVPPAASSLNAALNGSLLTLTPGVNSSGVYSVTVTASDGASSVSRTFLVNVVGRLQMDPIVDQTMDHRNAQLQLNLNATGDGPLNFNASISAYDGAAGVDQALGLEQRSGAPFDSTQPDAKWVFSTVQDVWYQILPSGAMRYWYAPTATGYANGVILPTLVYADTTLLTDPQPASSAAAVPLLLDANNGGVLTINPPHATSGLFQVTVTASDGGADVTRTFFLRITNNRPTLPVITDRSMLTTQDSLAFALNAGDLDGAADTLTYEVSVTAYSYLSDLDGVLGFERWAGNPIDPAQPNASWLYSTAQSTWYQILPTGELRYWHGPTATPYSTYVFLPTLVYADPSLLANPAAPPAASQLQAQVNGGTLTLDPSAGTVGVFAVTVTVTDGMASQTRSFFLNVAELPAAQNAGTGAFFLNPGQTNLALTVDLAGATNVSSRVKTTETLAYELDQSLQLGGVYAVDYYGQGEKWMQGASDYYALMPNGELRRWAGSVANTFNLQSSVVAVFTPDIYANPSKLYSAPPAGGTAPVALSWNGDQLVVTPNAGYHGTFVVELTVTFADSVVRHLMTIVV